jgi:hypothetical protein
LVAVGHVRNKGINMKPIMEAREGKKRIGNALREVSGVGTEYTYEKMENEKVIKTLEAVHRILVLAWRDLDAMIDEWEDERGIDRPL